MRPAMPPPTIPTTGSSEIGAAKLTCSWLKLFFRTDLLELPYDGDFTRPLEAGFWPSTAGRFLGLGLGLGLLEVHVMVGPVLLRSVNGGDSLVVLKRDEGMLK